MTPNVGSLDRILRFVLGLALLGLGYRYHSMWGLLGFGPLLSAVFRFCPAYLPFGLNTCATKKSPPPSTPTAA